MESNLIELAMVEGMIEAEIIKGKLESNGIAVHLQFETAGRIFGITMNGLGKVRILVARAEENRARELLQDHSAIS